VIRATALLAVCGAFALAGCGTGGLADEESTANGEQLFRQKCGTCHELGAAGTRGRTGPSLDAAFEVALDEGFDESTVREVVLNQMKYPIPPMPDAEELFPLKPGYTEADREDDLSAIANYVASVAGRPGAGGGTGGGGSASGERDPRVLFESNCASCHTFAPANATATIGPNLDQTTLALAAIERQIRQGGQQMPPFEGTLSDAQIEALAKFIFENR
jgi:mono/diheme cytochrome c family protein